MKQQYLVLQHIGFNVPAKSEKEEGDSEKN